jgi:ribosomal protein S2
MKIQKKQLFNTKLTKLKLLEAGIYTNKLNTPRKTIETVYNLKKALTVIYKYHINRKKILFVGEDLNLPFNFKKLLIGSNHIMLPKHVWMNGILTNKFMFFKHLKTNRNTLNTAVYTSLYKLKKRFNLIVIINSVYKENIIKESYQSNIPVIFLGNCLNSEYATSSYNIPGNFQFLKKKGIDKFFYLLLVALLKKGNIVKKYKKVNMAEYKKVNKTKNKKKGKNVFKKKNQR